MGWLRAFAFALILAAGLAAVDEVAASSTAPKPDPPPVRKKAPPPPPRPAPPPPVSYQAPPPPPIVSRPPSSGPTAAQIAAARRAAEAKAKAAKRAARLKKLKKQRRQARRAARLAAAKRAAKNRERDAGFEEGLGGQQASEGTGSSGFAANESARQALPFVVAAAVAALIILGLGLVPAYVVPWYRMSMVLEDHRQQFTFVGGMALLGAGIFLALTFLSG